MQFFQQFVQAAIAKIATFCLKAFFIVCRPAYLDHAVRVVVQLDILRIEEQIIPVLIAKRHAARHII